MDRAGDSYDGRVRSPDLRRARSAVGNGVVLMTETGRDRCEGHLWYFYGTAEKDQDLKGPFLRECAQVASGSWCGRRLCDEHGELVRSEPLEGAHVALSAAMRVLQDEAAFTAHYGDERSERLMAEGRASEEARSSVRSALRRKELVRLESALADGDGLRDRLVGAADGTWRLPNRGDHATGTGRGGR